MGGIRQKKWFAWYPVWVVDFHLRRHRWAWLEHVWWSRNGAITYWVN